MQTVGVERSLRRGANHEWVHTLARIGYATKGVVYLLIGALAFDATLSGRRPEGSSGAVRQLRELPFGLGLLALTAAGLFGYALWRAVQAVFDADHEGRGASGIFKRCGHFLAALAHGGLAVAALELALGEHGAGGDATKTWIGRLMLQPFGHVLVLGVGMGVIVFGASQIVSAVTGSFTRHLEQLRMSGRERRWVTGLGRLGLSARGIVFVTIGVLCARAGLDSNPNEAAGMSGALSWLRASTYGAWVLAAIAVGLFCYGLYMLACARFRHLGRV